MEHVDDRCAVGAAFMGAKAVTDPPWIYDFNFFPE